MNEEVLSTLNKFIRAEHGNPVKMSSIWKDAGIDSFGTTMVFADMDEKYKCFPKEWFTPVVWEELTIEEVVERVINESSII